MNWRSRAAIHAANSKSQPFESVNDISDLSVGMVIEGAVTNVTKFGAFVDIGVRGLIHHNSRTISFVTHLRLSLSETSSKSRCWRSILNDAELPYPENPRNRRHLQANGIRVRIAGRLPRSSFFLRFRNIPGHWSRKYERMHPLCWKTGGLSKAGGTPKRDRLREASHYWFPELFPRVVDLQFLEGD